jgi:hypothetical protein
MHLTNASVQKKDQAYNDSLKEFQVLNIFPINLINLIYSINFIYNLL